MTKFSVTAKATGNETAVDTSKLAKGRNITSYQIVTAKNGKLVKKTTADISDSVTVDTTDAEDIEILPVYEYNKTASYTTEITLEDHFPDGRYDITVTKAASDRMDLYINGYMAGYGIDREGDGREGIKAAYTAEDFKIEGGSITLKASSTQNGGGSLSHIKIVQRPSIVKRKTRIYTLGDSLVCIYYGGDENNYLGTTQTGWGQVLDKFINTEKYAVTNLANSGNTAKDSYDAAFPSVLYNAEAGDILLFESGVNDYWKQTSSQKSETPGADSNKSTMAGSLTNAVREAKAKNIKIILVTPNASPGQSTYPVYFSDVVLCAAKKENTEYIDLARMTSDLHGELYDHDIDAIKASFGVTNDTMHTSYIGAVKYASLIAAALYRLGYEDIANFEFEYIKRDKSGKPIVCRVLY